MTGIDDKSETSQMMASASSWKSAGANVTSCLLLVLAAFPAVAWAQFGYVHEVSGEVSMQAGLGKSGAPKPGDKIDSGTRISTGSDGKVTLKYADGQLVILNSGSNLRIGQYRFDPKNVKQSASALVLTKGELRFVTGIIGADHPEGIRITAAGSTIGILKPGGADFIVSVNPDPEETGLAASARGDIYVRTPYGPIEKIEANEMVPWQPGRLPPLPVPIASLPAVVQAAMTALFATLVPSNTPVNVAAAASDAAFVAFVPVTRQSEDSTSTSKFSIDDLGALLAALPATAAGPAQSQVVAAPAPSNGFPVAPAPPPVTSGGGGRCTGSAC